MDDLTDKIHEVDKRLVNVDTRLKTVEKETASNRKVLWTALAAGISWLFKIVSEKIGMPI